MTQPDPPAAGPAAASPLCSVHSTNLPDILRRLGIALAISTYQVGRLVIARAEPDGA